MAERYFISDTHFGHDAVYTFVNKDGSRVRDFADTAEEGDQVMIERWNSVVGQYDKAIANKEKYMKAYPDDDRNVGTNALARHI